MATFRSFQRIAAALTLPVALLSLLCFASVLASLRARAQQARPAYPADAFVETVGINSGVTTKYWRNPDLSIDAIKELGVRYVREPASISGSASIRRLKREHREGNVRFLLTTSYRDPNSTIPKVMNLIEELGTGAIAGVEGPNEPDLSDGESGWVERTRAYQCALYRAIKGNPATNDLLVLTPSVTSIDAAKALSPVADCSDAGNLHHYFASRHPETDGWGDDGYGSIDWNRNHIVREMMLPGRPYNVTETGWRLATKQNGYDGIKERTATRYLPRLYLEYFRRHDLGAERLYTFEIWSANEGFGWNLVRNDGTRRPAFHALKNLISILEDPGPHFAPDTLEIGIDAASEDVHSVLLKKRSGDYFVALWRAVPSEHPDNRKLYEVSSVSTTLRVGAALKDANHWTLNDDGSFSFTENVKVNAEGVPNLLVSDQVTLVQLTLSER